ncbi:hypothetical protein PIIN_10247 [Serendipita indica DSM 11827]|uniref:Uncharacterized protein n=1 Tax=Serendipita indica (strain DSM 11827) TaxID=1109443 RepID=G4U2L4_SERID|nr:hypothetical protein PIIN_10247 [Serendipita indica DSM 11827]
MPDGPVIPGDIRRNVENDGQILRRSIRVDPDHSPHVPRGRLSSRELLVIRMKGGYLQPTIDQIPAYLLAVNGVQRARDDGFAIYSDNVGSVIVGDCDIFNSALSKKAPSYRAHVEVAV